MYFIIINHFWQCISEKLLKPEIVESSKTETLVISFLQLSDLGD